MEGATPPQQCDVVLASSATDFGIMWLPRRAECEQINGLEMKKVDIQIAGTCRGVLMLVKVCATGQAKH